MKNGKPSVDSLFSVSTLKNKRYKLNAIELAIICARDFPCKSNALPACNSCKKASQVGVQSVKNAFNEKEEEVEEEEEEERLVYTTVLPIYDFLPFSFSYKVRAQVNPLKWLFIALSSFFLVFQADFFDGL